MSMAEDMLFARIVWGEIPADIVCQDELVTAFRDINPCAPTHILIVLMFVVASSCPVAVLEGVTLPGGFQV